MFLERRGLEFGFQSEKEECKKSVWVIVFVFYTDMKCKALS